MTIVGRRPRRFEMGVPTVPNMAFQQQISDDGPTHDTTLKSEILVNYLHTVHTSLEACMIRQRMPYLYHHIFQ